MLPLAVALATVTLAASAQAADPFGSGSRQNLDFYFSVDGYGSGGRFEEPSDLALDERSGLIYVTDQKAGVVDAFSLQGVAKFQYGAKNGLKAPVGVAVDRQGNVFVSEAAGGSIKIINSKGETTSLDVPEDPEPGHEAPKAGRMTFDRDGTLYVVDRANSQILAFDKDRKFKFRFGSVGDKRGEFKLLQDVATDRQGRIYAADALGTPVQVFDRKGGFIYGFGMRGRGAESLSFPAGLFVDRQDQVWVVDKNQHLLKVYDRAGLYLRTFGSYGQGEGSLFYPVAAAEDSLGRVYVLEFGTRRLQVFTLAQPFEPFTP
jgi:DNA-binding beta-propeller fold protein YncE